MEIEMNHTSKQFGMTYFLAAIGAAVFYVQQSTTFWEQIIAFASGARPSATTTTL